MIKNLIFDIDGTIWDSTQVAAKGWNKAAKAAGIADHEITADILKREFGLPMDAIAAHIFPFVTDKEKLSKLLDDCCKYEQEFLEENEKDISYPGVRDGFKLLSNNYSLYIVSNCQCGYIELTMRKNGIEKYIKDFECFGNTGLKKHETMALLMERNGLAPKESAYIGDTLGDKDASMKAGVTFIYASYGFGDLRDEPYKIDSFGELPSLLMKISNLSDNL